MADEPDLAFDIDALFEHLTVDLDHELTDELEWAFIVRSSDYAALEEAAHEFEDEFAIHLFEEVDELDEEGNATPGDPLMCVICVEALTAEQVKEIAARVDAVAAARGLEYEGVQCADPLDEDGMHDWVQPGDVSARLNYMTEAGVEADAELAWTLLVVAPDPASTDKIAEAAVAAGFADFDQFDERDEEGDCGICLFVPGTNNEAALAATIAKLNQISEPHGGQLAGVQFFTREEFYDAFAVDEEEGEEASDDE
ncbi:hypothetical protein Pla123a_00060 [Posidoniimonas polymericola]|uniref:Uncharacterized protein n=1 Tax=Posidoniimonas polymericola TaxID=2528002 RepID=A0A5C5ZDG4_9BACT|nr:ribonuclease E inhibitor RraB [Posidoniimonas polymericola]TWT85200.1 hypothetical protein Pla123a_00060 [Posidoniimonas polymericola]